MKHSAWKWIGPVLVLIAGLCWAGEYRIGPGDVLGVKVYGEKDLSKSYEVYRDGSIRVPWIRDVVVQGLTTREVEDKIESLLSPDYLVNPQVTVTVEKFESKKVYVLGAVKNPGQYGLKGPTNLLEAISMAGGITDQGGKRFTLIRGGDVENPDSIKSLVDSDAGEKSIEDFTKQQSQVQVFNIDGYRLLDQGDLTQNMALENGDIVSVLKTQLVYCDGEVKKPGSVDYEEGLTLMRAISLAGGLTTMAGNKVTVTREKDGHKQTIKISLRDLAKGDAEDMKVLPGDIVYVKRSIF